VKTTRYFEEQVLRKRPYIDRAMCDIDRAMCDAVLAAPLRRTIQDDGRVRHWASVLDARDGQERVLRVVTLEDGETVHNAFFDRDFVRD
jgi:hypothetical protein